jgi:6,7-dimethyl-8-ribityllumazine synthase
VDQAVDRAGSKTGHKGFDAALSSLEMVDVLFRIA